MGDYLFRRKANSGTGFLEIGLESWIKWDSMIISDEEIPGAYSYCNREERARFIVEQFGWALKEPLLDVGCGEKHLQQALPEGFDYTGLDFIDRADVHCNLDRDKIPFKQKSFNTVVCTDVLEHLEHIHDVFNDLLGIASRYVIVSLPNCWSDLKYLMLKGRGSGKYYGLPSNRPEDRHRWFFNYSEARQFLIDNSTGKVSKLNLYRYYAKGGITYKAGRLFLPAHIYRDLFVHTLWAVIEI